MHKESIAGVILLISFVLVLGYFFGGSVQPDHRTDGGYQRSGSSAHPIWNE